MNLDIWNDNPDIKLRIEKIIAHQRQLQKELGLESLTIDQRIQIYKKRKEEEARLAEEQARIKEQLSKLPPIRKPPLLPKIKK